MIPDEGILSGIGILRLTTRITARPRYHSVTHSGFGRLDVGGGVGDHGRR